MSQQPMLRTTKVIAHEMGVSTRTIARMVKKGVLPVQKGGCGGRTSPLMISRDALIPLTTKNRKD
ncbi:hypothetical protein ACLBXM_19890 [Xanthobacteraceae bacterium A53D]